MTKFTKVVYECDVCGSQSESELPTCGRCKLDYCNNCTAIFTLNAVVEGAVFKPFFDIKENMCQLCGNKINVSLTEGAQEGDYKLVFSD